MFRLLLCFSLLLVRLGLSAQAPTPMERKNKANTSLSAKELRKKAYQGHSYFANEDYHKALEAYEAVLETEPGHAEALRNVGICRLMLFSDVKAVELIKKARSIDPRLDSDYDYWIGRAYHLNLKFDSAAVHYESYKQSLSRADKRLREIERLIEQTRLGKKYVRDSMNYIYHNLGANVNSPYSDHSPMLTRDGKTLIFTSTRTDSLKGGEITSTGDAYENVYVSHYENGSWSKPFQIKAVDAKKRHTSNMQFFDNDSKMLLYRSQKRGGLLVSEKKDSNWTQPKPFNEHLRSNEANGFVMQGGNVIYFSSSRSGNMDLYVTRKGENGKWSEPERLPDIINSSEDEENPFVSEDGKTLYFASRGHDSMGGFDMFHSTYDEKTQTWSKPVNMGYPTNSPGNDLFLHFNPQNQASFITSDRAGGMGQEDLYMIQLYGDVMVYVRVVEQGQDRILQGYTIKLKDTDKAEDKLLVTDSTGEYKGKLRPNRTYKALITDENGKILKEETFFVSANQNAVQKTFEVPVEQLEKIAKLLFDDRYLVKLKYEPSKDLILKGTVKDSLSFQPVSEAVVHLREEGSTEVLQTTRTDTRGRYEIRYKPDGRKNFVIEILSPPYMINSIALLYSDTIPYKSNETEFRRIQVNYVEVNSLMHRIKTGSRTVWGGIYFDFNKANLRPESKIVLDKLYNFLVYNPSITIEISGHTDGIGPAYVNLRLSQRRTQGVIDYLRQRGIPQHRVIGKAYGSSRPIAPNESELNGRDANRRVEIMILKK
jgi:outer membrane protein OmpA-like peptidoglycan-associated protein/ribosomal protein L24E